jgi:hypothetical protein
MEEGRAHWRTKDVLHECGSQAQLRAHRRAVPPTYHIAANRTLPQISDGMSKLASASATETTDVADGEAPVSSPVVAVVVELGVVGVGGVGDGGGDGVGDGVGVSSVVVVIVTVVAVIVTVVKSTVRVARTVTFTCTPMLDSALWIVSAHESLSSSLSVATACDAAAPSA